MDLGATLHHSRRLVGLPPSTSPPPLQERMRQARRTDTHFDSHTYFTMIHTSEVPKGSPSSPPEGKTLPERLYGTLEYPNHFVAGTSHDVQSQFLDYINSDRRY